MHNEPDELPADLQQVRSEQSKEIRASLSEFERLNEVDPGGIRAEYIKSINVAAQQRIENQNIYLYQNQEQEDRLVREAHQRTRIKEQREFLPNRLKDFVGRANELDDLQAKIAQQQLQGGYVIVTGEAGQGKSSLITKLIVELGEEKVGAFHFVPVNVGHDHQISLLRDLVRQLVYKHDLPRWYLSESYATLRENFREILEEITKQGKQEILCLDGLDLLEMTASGEPDLSFLPRNLPAGIAFVIGTRPNEVLNQVQRLAKSYAKCEVGQLGHEPFALLLHQRQITVSDELSQRLYQAMQGNALYLSVLIQVLDTQRDQPAEKIIAQVENNPDGIFTLAFARLKQRRDDWRNVIRPLLGTLLVAREPLTAQQLAHISAGENDLFREGIKHLGGFLTNTGQERYTLFHLKLYEYLRQDQSHPERDYEFDAEEEAAFHGKLAAWCGQGEDDYLWSDIPDRSFQDDYREYARRHYITHLYHAGMDKQLFTVLDNGTYERGKLHQDVSARSVVQDLTLGCQAAAREAATLDKGIAQLTHLWRYTLLRSSLTSRADAYPLETFEALLALGMSREALDLAELLTQPERKLDAFLLLAQHFIQQPERMSEGQQLFHRARDLIAALENQQSRTERLEKLVLAHIQVGQLDLAETVARTIEDELKRSAAFSSINAAYGRKQAWDKAEASARLIAQDDERLKALSVLAAERELAGEEQQADAFWQEVSTALATIPDDKQRDAAYAHLAGALLRVKHWKQAEAVAHAIAEKHIRVEVLSELALALTLAGEQAQAQILWGQVDASIRSTSASIERTKMQRCLVAALARANRWDEANEVVRQMSDGAEQAHARASIVMSLIEAQRWQESQAAMVEMARRYKRDELIGSQFDEMLIAFAIALTRSGQGEQARRVVQMIAHAQTQRRANLSLVSTCVALGQQERAQTVWHEAHATSTFQASAGLRSALCTLISAFAHTEKDEQAREMIDSSTDEAMREDLICTLAIALAQTARIEQAKAQVENISHLHKKAAVQLAILQALLEAGEIDQAKEVALAIAPEEDRWQALKQVVGAYAQGKQWKQAQNTALLIAAGSELAAAISDLVVAMVQDDQADTEQFKQAEDIIKSLPKAYNYAKYQIWCDLAAALERRHALRFAEKARRKIKNERILKKEYCYRLLLRQQMPEAERVARGIEEQNVRDEALLCVALAYGDAQEWKRAQAVAVDIQDWQKQCEILYILATKTAQSGQWEHALAAYEALPWSYRLAVAQSWGKLLEQTGERAQAEKILDELKDGQERASFQAGIAHVMGENGRDQDLIRFTQQAWTQAETQEDCLREFALARPLIEHYPDLGSALYDVFAWVDTFL